MRILFIADNRDRYNWGCRGTSAALSEIIGKEHEVVGRISGRLTLSRDFVYIPLWNGKLNTLVYKNKMISKILLKVMKRLPRSVTNRFDFLSVDFDRCIERIIKYARVNKTYAEINLDAYEYDAIVINGEGTMIMTSPCRRDTLYYLLFVYWAEKRGKKVFFMNAMFSDCPKTGRNENTISLIKNTLPKCSAITIRDPLSYRYAKDVMCLEDCRYVPDALFTWIKYYQKENTINNIRDILPFGYESDRELSGVDIFHNDYICVSGSSAAAWTPSEAVKAYAKLVRALKRMTCLSIFLVQVCAGDSFLEEVARMTDTVYIPAQIPIVSGLNLLAHARLYISGRYHPSIMASGGGVHVSF